MRRNPHKPIRFFVLLVTWLFSIPLLIQAGFVPGFSPLGVWHYPTTSVVVACLLTLLETFYLYWASSVRRKRLIVLALKLFVLWSLFWMIIGFWTTDAGGVPIAHAEWLALVWLIGAISLVISRLWPAFDLGR